jgi:hypothetical protein
MRMDIQFLPSQWLMGGRNMPGLFCCECFCGNLWKAYPIAMTEKSFSSGKVE